jgi:hypothetical protein
VAVFRLALRRLREAEDPFFKGLLTGFIAGFVGLVAHSLGTNTFILVRIMEPFWFLVGMIAVLPLIPVEQAIPSAASGRSLSARFRAPEAVSRRRRLSASLPARVPGSRFTV